MPTPTTANITASNTLINIDSGVNLNNLIVSGTSNTSYQLIGGTDTAIIDSNSRYTTTGFNFVDYTNPFYGFGKDGEIRIDPDTGECKVYIANKTKWIECEILEKKKSTDKNGKKINIFSISFDLNVSDIKEMQKNRNVLVEKTKKLSVTILDGINYANTITHTYIPQVHTYVPQTFTLPLTYTTPSITIGTNNIICGTNITAGIGDIVYDNGTNQIKINNITNTI